MNNRIKKLQKYIKNNFIFYAPGYDTEGNDIYFCKCGEKIISHPNSTTLAIKLKHDGTTVGEEFDDDSLTNFGIDAFGSAYRKANLICPSCHINYSEQSIYTKIQNVHVKFYDKYDIHEDKNFITLYKLRGQALLNNETANVSIDVEESYIKISKKSKRIKYQSFPSVDGMYDQPISVHLENIIKVSKEILKNTDQTYIVTDFVYIHDFLGRIAKEIIDTKNMNIIEELMVMMSGKSGLNILQKILTIFLGILCYPNLSTIALTKGNTFLYDLLENCPLPKKSFLKKQNATSPIKIFNTLVSLKNIQLQNNLDEDDITKLGYVFKTNTGQKVNIKYNKNQIKNLTEFKEATLIGKEGDNSAMVFVRDKVKDKKISPFIFNKLSSFNDYEKLIQWLKFVTYDQLINLIKLYDIELLNIILKRIEFRDDITYSRLQQFIPLMINYAQFKTVDKLELENGKDFTLIENIHIDYQSIKAFDFSIYDDSLRMIYELELDPNKVLYKIKQNNKLIKFHNDLTKHRNYISDSKINKKYEENSSKFKYLEGIKIHPEKLYTFDIRLIISPKELLDLAIKMKNCAGSYIARVANGEYIPFLLLDNSPKREKEEFYRYLMILKITKLGLEFVGVKTACNQYGSDRFKNDIKQFLIDHDISFQEVTSIKSGVKSTENSYDGTFEKIISNNYIDENLLDQFKK